MVYSLYQQSLKWRPLRAGKGFPGMSRIFHLTREPAYLAAAANLPGTLPSWPLTSYVCPESERTVYWYERTRKQLAREQFWGDWWQIETEAPAWTSKLCSHREGIRTGKTLYYSDLMRITLSNIWNQCKNSNIHFKTKSSHPQLAQLK